MIISLTSLMTVNHVYAEINPFHSYLKNHVIRVLMPQVSPKGNTTFVVWQDNSTGNEEIFLRKSLNGGITFGNINNLSNNNASSISPQIESFGNTTFVVWQDNSTGNEEIFLRKSLNGGITFGNINNLSNNNASSISPQIESFGNTTFVVWQDNSTGNEEIFLRKSLNGGITFGNINNLSNNNASSISPQIESFGNTTFVVWQDNSTGNEEIFLRKSLNGGITFGNINNLSNNNASSISPQIESFGNTTFVDWQDNSTGNEEIFLRKSLNGGITFGNITNLSNNNASSISPQIESFGNTTFVVWQDNSTGNEEIFLRKSLNGGITFGNINNLSNNNASSISPQIESFGNTTFVVWQDNSTGNEEIFLRKSLNGGITFGNINNLSNNNASSISPQIESFGNTTFVVWQDNSTGNEEIFLRKSLNGGITFGNINNLSNNNASSISPQIESFGNTTFVVWQDNSTGNEEIFLRKSLNGGITFGNINNLSNNNASSISPQIESFGNTTFVDWQDNSTGNEEIFLRKSLNGGITFGNITNLSNNNASSISPQIESFGNTTFVVWQDNSTGNEEIFLRKSLNGGITFGNINNLSNNNASSISPQIESFGNTTFVVWQDNSTGNEEIFLRKSLNGGITFGNINNLSNNNASSISPQIESFGNTTFVDWQDNSTGNEEIFLRKSLNGGITFGNITNLSNNNASSISPQIESFGNTTFVVWQDNSTGNEEIFLRKSLNGGITFGNINNLSNNNASSISPQIESFGNTTFVDWQDNSTGNEEIFLRKSLNGGITFGNITNLSNNNASSISPQIESFGNTTFVVWQDNSTGNEEIFLRKSLNGGITFGNINNLSNNNASSISPQIESFGNTTFVVWQDNSTGNQEIFLRKSLNGGITFGNIINLINNNASSISPQIESFGNTTFVVWQDNSTGNEEIFLRKSNDGHNKFYDPKNMTELSVQYKGGPIMNDSNLKVEIVAIGINFLTSMAFLGPNDNLVLEKNEGKVKRIVNGSILVDPLLDVNVANERERGMLGITTSNQEIKDKDKPVYVFLYYTETKSRDGEDLKGGDPLGNRLYRFELVKD